MPRLRVAHDAEHAGVHGPHAFPVAQRGHFNLELARGLEDRRSLGDVQLELAHRLAGKEAQASIDLQNAETILRQRLSEVTGRLRQDALVDVAQTLALQGRTDDAIAMLEKAVSFEPENGVIRGRLEQLKSYRRR